eukprot:11917636-Alexandrium_andersonii.AAC.1
MSASLVGSEMCIRDSSGRASATASTCWGGCRERPGSDDTHNGTEGGAAFRQRRRRGQRAGRAGHRVQAAEGRLRGVRQRGPRLRAAGPP